MLSLFPIDVLATVRPDCEVPRKERAWAKGPAVGLIWAQGGEEIKPTKMFI